MHYNLLMNKCDHKLKILANDYFESFSKKNLDHIESMLSSEVILKDWDIFAEGKKDFLLTTKNIFDSVNTIKVEVKNMYIDKNTIIAKLEILINSKDLLKVVDIIQFDRNGKILNIRAYKG